MPEIDSLTYQQQTLTFEIVTENALLVTWPENISIEQHNKILAVQVCLNQQLFQYIIESLVSYNSLMLYYNFLTISSTQFVDKVKQLLSDNKKLAHKAIQQPTIKIPVLYDKNQQWDLAEVADHSKLTIDEVIQQHCSQTYHSFALGFTPGFCYLAEVPETIRMPRKTSPRLSVPKGAIAIAERQTAIYPVASPGGWQVIGQTPMAMSKVKNGKFTPAISVGASVQFYAISEAEYHEMATSTDVEYE